MAHLKKTPRKFITIVITIIMIAIFALLGSCKSEEKRTATILSGILPDLKNESITLIPVQDYFPALSLTESYPTVKTDIVGWKQSKIWKFFK
jgi:hypothetical protein